MRRKHRRTLASIFQHPTPSGIRWDDIESLLLACGADIEERAGSRMAVKLSGRVAIFHRPHLRKEADKGSIASVRKFLERLGITAEKWETR